jgi:hypothetical protein
MIASISGDEDEEKKKKEDDEGSQVNPGAASSAATREIRNIAPAGRRTRTVVEGRCDH